MMVIDENFFCTIFFFFEINYNTFCLFFEHNRRQFSLVVVVVFFFCLKILIIGYQNSRNTKRYSVSVFRVQQKKSKQIDIVIRLRFYAFFFLKSLTTIIYDLKEVKKKKEMQKSNAKIYAIRKKKEKNSKKICK